MVPPYTSTNSTITPSLRSPHYMTQRVARFSHFVNILFFLCFLTIHLHFRRLLAPEGPSTKESNLQRVEGRAGADHHGEMLKKGGERESNGNIVNIVLVFHMKKGK